MKNTLFICLAFILLSLRAAAQKQTIQGNDYKCTFQTEQGMMNGPYVSYYNNGQKKAEGTFENNCRTGLWTVWDSTGRMRAQREYENLFTFKRIFPVVPNEKPIELLNIPVYSLKYNSDGYIDYFPPEERMVVWVKRLWRYLDLQENQVLSAYSELFNQLNKNILNKNLIAYSTENDEFLTELAPTFDTTEVKIIGYKIKEDCFFDNERMVTESRIIGICPVVTSPQWQGKRDYYWIYLPDARKYLAQIKISKPGLPANIKTLDDLLFFRYFYAPIYKESNVYDRKISDYKYGEDIKKEAARFEILLIEIEHDYWISFTK